WSRQESNSGFPDDAKPKSPPPASPEDGGAAEPGGFWAPPGAPVVPQATSQRPITTPDMAQRQGRVSGASRLLFPAFRQPARRILYDGRLEVRTTQPIKSRLRRISGPRARQQKSPGGDLRGSVGENGVVVRTACADRSRRSDPASFQCRGRSCTA